MPLARILGSDLRVAMVSMHTSPLDQPGSGDAGGLNVYVAQTAQRLADAGASVDVFTRASSRDQQPTVEAWPGVTVFNLPAGRASGLRKEDLPGQVCPFTAELLRTVARRPAGYYDVVHSHYWLSGQAGWLAAERWSVPLVHTMHTMAKVKNESLAAGDEPEPLMRVLGEEHLVAEADRLVVNTADEREDIVRLYGADDHRVDVVHPGVDLDVFRPEDGARQRLGIRPDRRMVLFVGRIQPLKAPDLLVRAVADLVRRDPARRDDLQVVICGGLSGSGLARPDHLAKLAAELGVAELVEFLPPAPRPVLADLFRAADIVAVPSHSESFGLVALESQACGTPVLAARVGGLRTAVADGGTGILVDGHDPHRWGRALGDLLDAPGRLADLAARAPVHAASFSWSATAAGMLATYQRAIRDRAGDALRAAN